MRFRNGQNPISAASICLLLLTAGEAFSDPNITITGVTGTLGEGQTLSISGLGFGVKSPPAPVLWDDFEGHTVGSPIGNPVVGHYTRTGNTVYSQVDPYTGGRCTFSPIRATQSEPGLVADWIPNLALDGFASMKFKIISTYGDITPHNIKLIRLNTSDPDPTHGSPNLCVGKDRGYVNFNCQINNALDGMVYLSGFDSLPEPDDWNSISIWDHLGTPNVANGFAGRQIGGSVSQRSNIITQQSAAGFMGGLRAAYFCGYISRDGYDADLYLDDVYADTTLARVQIVGPDGGNHEMQIPVSWSSNSIQVAAHPGRYPPGTQVQLIVYDAENRASNPFTMTVGTGSTEPGPPGTPGQPIRQ